MLKLILSLLLFTSNVLADVKWQEITEDLDLTRISLQEDNLLTPEILFVRTGLKKFKPVVIQARDHGMDRATVSSLADKSGLSLGINANFFDEKGSALGLVINQGIAKNKLHRGGKTLTGIFYFAREQIGIVNRNDFNPTQVVEAIQAGPRLLDQQIRVDLSTQDYPTRRSGICIDANNKLIFYITSGIFGITLKDLQTLLLKAGCKDALNLDGGGSSQFFMSKDITKESDDQDFVIAGRDNVPVILGLNYRH